MPRTSRLSILSTRQKARELARAAEQAEQTRIDLSNVEFVTRTLTAEISRQAEDRGLELIGAEGDVARMLQHVQS